MDPEVKILEAPAAVIGSGAAGLAAAVRLSERGIADALLITEDIGAGTSVGAGSDKQTYSRLSPGGTGEDSVRRMAKDLFACGCVDGDTALCEAALSSEAFFNLVRLGVEFPSTEFGEYVGYRTDHDPLGRATSAGPYTSADICRCLREEAARRGIKLLDRLAAVKIFASCGSVAGVLCLDLSAEPDVAFTLIRTPNVILATGGPAGMFDFSVYPESQTGSSGIAFEAGAAGKNLTEWQYGPASVSPRWNVSGSFMQVIPRIISRLPDGSGERELLPAPDATLPEIHSLTFFKGYQWPFDSRKLRGRYRSSLVDLAIEAETAAGRQVFLDFTRNPDGLDFSALDPEARDYIVKAEIAFGTPAERLYALNRPAYEFYLSHGIDLFKTPLRIAECVQHNNGGLAADADWQTRVRGLYAVGEVCGTHGIVRPGGSALNAGQVGAIRAADSIAKTGLRPRPEIDPDELARAVSLPFRCRGGRSASDLLAEARRQTSLAAGISRREEALELALSFSRDLLAEFERKTAPEAGASGARTLYMLRDTLISQTVYLSAMLDYARDPGISRGSALYRGLPAPEGGPAEPDVIRETFFDPATLSCRTVRRPVRPIPDEPGPFESEWEKYRKRVSGGN
ncbi:MAG: FAD-binding protein [Clostridia bacterium]|nr:FAD-binding protein [Clostridia bacterium]